MPEIQHYSTHFLEATNFKTRLDEPKREAFNTPDRKTQARNLSPGRKSMKYDQENNSAANYKLKINAVRLFF
jgi:hypothetical protein